MADLHQFAIAPHFDLEQTLREAQHRWLTLVEMCEIFRNHRVFPKTTVPPNRPPSGSLLLFDFYVEFWKGLQDCYNWRKEKDGKTVKLAFETINAGSNDVLEFYPSHLEENENFQKRVCWIIKEPVLVLVHYLEIKMERSSVNQVDLDDTDEVETTTQAGNAQATEPGAQTSVPKKRKFFSKIWEHYDILPSETQLDKKQRAKCKKCPHTFLSASTNGTGNMRRHLNTCSGQTRDVGQMLLSQNESHNSSLRETKFNYEVFREMLSQVILRHELPFRFVEYEGIRNLLNYVANQEIKAISGNTLKSDTLKMYHKEKNRLKKMLRDIPGRISLTCDLWSSVTRDDYLSLTAHFVNQDWKLEKKLLNFSYMPSPHNSPSICEKVHALLTDWDIDCKLTSITLDNASFHDSFVGFLKDRLNLDDALLSKGDHFHIRCCARIVNLIVQDCLKEIDSAVEKIRESVRYYRGSQERRRVFKEAVKKVALPSQKKLQQDVPTRWNSIFLMLDSAVFYQKAFEELQKSDDSYKCCPSGEEWVKVKEICEFLVLFYDVTCTFSGTKYPTSYLHYPQVFIIKQALTEAISGFDPFMAKMAEKMQLKFEKYWSSSKENLVLVFVVVLDPRYKLQFVEYCYKEIYGEESQEIVEVREKLWNLFNTYVRTYSKATENSEPWEKPTNEREAPSTSKWRTRVFEVFDKLGGENISPTKSQLQLYLDEPRMERPTNMDILASLDILAFWQAHQYRYPELSLMARDLLSIPVSTVSSESSFNVGERVIDVFRKSLEPANAEALICTRDWMFERRGEVMSENLEANLEDIVDNMVLLAIDR